MSFFPKTLVALSLLFCIQTAGEARSAQYLGVDRFTLVGGALSNIGSSYGGTPVSGQQIVGTTGSGVDAALWTSPDGALTNLHSPNQLNFVYSAGLGTDGIHQVGYAYLPDQHAILWNSTAESAIDLHPKRLGLIESYATGVAFGIEVGVGKAVDGSLRALLWKGTAESVVDLQPTNLQGVEWTAAFATDGNEQVGFMNRWISDTTLQGHAALWRGTADSAVDLHPAQWPSYRGSQAQGVGGGQQVGLGIVDIGNTSEFHALMWSGTAESAVDLHPSQVTNLYASTAYGTDGVHQIGFIQVAPTFNSEAVLWSGSADSMVNLHTLLPIGMKESFAYSVDNGTIYGIATDFAGQVHAVMWTPVAVPEPAIAAMLASVVLTRATTRQARIFQD